MRRLLAMSVLAVAAACGATRGAEPSAGQAGIIDAETAAKLNASLMGPQRPEAEKARDKYRHPLETLSFFGLKDDMTVVELAAGGGWYTAVLAPVLADKGHLVEPMIDPSAPDDTPGVKYSRKLDERLKADPATYAKVEKRAQMPGEWNLGAPGSADMVVTFRSLHGMTPDEQEKLFAAVAAVLKPGGVFGVEDHRALEGVPMDPKATGYVDEKAAIERIEKAGLKLVAKSDVNNNPKDTKDYDKGVWALPPSLQNGETDKAKYEAIGESDRFTLRFVKS